VGKTYNQAHKPLIDNSTDVVEVKIENEEEEKPTSTKGKIVQILLKVALFRDECMKN